jgi:hypothetical protein
MLPAKKLDFRLEFGTFFCRKYHPTPRSEYGILFKHLLDSDFTFQALGLCDPSDGYIGGFRMIDEALLQNLERETLF